MEWNPFLLVQSETDTKSCIVIQSESAVCKLKFFARNSAFWLTKRGGQPLSNFFCSSSLSFILCVKKNRPIWHTGVQLNSALWAHLHRQKSRFHKPFIKACAERFHQTLAARRRPLMLMDGVLSSKHLVFCNIFALVCRYFSGS